MDVETRTLGHPPTSSAQLQEANGPAETGSLFKRHFCDKNSPAQHEAAAAAAHGASDSEHDQFNGFTPTPPTQPLQEPFAPVSPEFTSEFRTQVGDFRTQPCAMIRDDTRASQYSIPTVLPSLLWCDKGLKPHSVMTTFYDEMTIGTITAHRIHQQGHCKFARLPITTAGSPAAVIGVDASSAWCSNLSA